MERKGIGRNESPSVYIYVLCSLLKTIYISKHADIRYTSIIEKDVLINNVMSNYDVSIILYIYQMSFHNYFDICLQIIYNIPKMVIPILLHDQIRKPVLYTEIRDQAIRTKERITDHNSHNLSPLRHQHHQYLDKT